MKKSMSVFLVSLLVITVLTFMLINIQRTEYVLPPEISLALFGTEPEEFFTTYRELYDYCEDFRKHAQIDEKGNLVLRLTKAQEKALLKSEDSNIEETKKIDGISISDDYSSIVICGTKEQISNIIWNEFDLFTIADMANRQLLSGKEPSSISISFKVVEKSTGRVVYAANWPQEAIELAVKKWQFSE